MSQKPPTGKNYQQMAAKLAEYIDWFESEAVSLDEALLKYEQAITLLSDMEKYLKTAENKISKIKAKFE